LQGNFTFQHHELIGFSNLFIGGTDMRSYFICACAAMVSGCSTFPHNVKEGIVEIEQVTAAIECELAAVALDPDQRVREKNIDKWNALTDLDLTLVRSLGADGTATVTGPAGLGIVSGTPKFGVVGTDTRTGHLQFSTSIKGAKTRYGATCQGYDPSETRMGLANWFAAALKAVPSDDLAGVTYTKQFEIVATAGARFGYTLIPVTNTVSADAGFAGAIDKTNRFSIALAPPDPPKKPIPVYWVPTPGAKTGVAGGAGPGPTGQGTGGGTGGTGPRAPRVSTNPELYYLLQRKSPLPLAR
jgi:hypothetical protein